MDSGDQNELRAKKKGVLGHPNVALHLETP